MKFIQPGRNFIIHKNNFHTFECSAMEKFKNNEKKKSQKCLKIKVKVEKEQIGRHA